MDEITTLTLTLPNQVMTWWDEPTVKLRWNNGTLEQMHWRRGLNSYGLEITREEEWRPVPDAALSTPLASEGGTDG